MPEIAVRHCMVRLPLALHAMLKELAVNEQRSMHRTILKLLYEALDQRAQHEQGDMMTKVSQMMALHQQLPRRGRPRWCPQPKQSQ